MRIAVTGGTGFIGRVLIRALRDNGHSVIALSRDLFRAKEILGDGVELVHWEVGRRPSPWEGEIGRADAIVNLAGETPALVFLPFHHLLGKLLERFLPLREPAVQPGVLDGPGHQARHRR